MLYIIIYNYVMKNNDKIIQWIFSSIIATLREASVAAGYFLFLAITSEWIIIVYIIQREGPLHIG